MKVLDFENQLKCLHFPINLKKDKNNKIIKIVGQTNGYNDFKNLSSDEIKIRNKKQMKLMASDTSVYHRLDVDNLELFKKLFDISIFNNTPYYLSRNKKFPHYYIKLINCNINKPIISIKHNNINVCDILIGQWAWYKTNENIINSDKQIINIDYNIFNKYTTNNIKNTKESDPINTNIIKQTNDNNISIDYINKLIKCLNPLRYNYNDWLNVGLILYNINIEYLNIWVDWSRQSDNFNYNECIHKWGTFGNSTNKLTIATLIQMAKEDNEEEYNKLQILNSMKDDTDENIANIFYNKFKSLLVCAVETPKSVWYYYKKGIWKKLDGTSLIRKLYSVDLAKLYNLKKKELEIIIKKEYNEFPKVQPIIKQEINIKYGYYTISTVYKYLKTYKKVTEYIKQSIHLFKDDEFENKLNNNPNILCFGEYLYDLKNLKWRKTQINDYCSISTNYNHEIVNNKYEKELLEILENTFIDKKEREFMLNNLALLLYGRNDRQIFNIWMGTGANGKSLLTSYIKYAFGGYYTTLPVSLITSKRNNANAASPELAKARFSRIAVFTEPEQGTHLNNSLMKELTGGDEISCRELYGAPFSYIPQFTSIILVNEFKLQDCGDDSIARRLIFSKFRTSFINGEIKATHQKKRNDKINSPDYIDKIKGSFMNLLINQYIKLSKNNFKFNVPKSIIEDKYEFLDDNDLIKSFINDNIEITNNKNDFIKLKDIYSRYKELCKENGEEIKPKKIIKARLMKSLSFVQRKQIGSKGNAKNYKSIFINCKFTDELDSESDSDNDE